MPCAVFQRGKFVNNSGGEAREARMVLGKLFHVENIKFISILRSTPQFVPSMAQLASSVYYNHLIFDARIFKLPLKFRKIEVSSEARDKFVYGANNTKVSLTRQIISFFSAAMNKLLARAKLKQKAISGKLKRKINYE